MRGKLAIVLCTVGLMACAHDEKYDGLSFDLQSSPPVPVSVESDRIELVAGIAVKVRVTPESDGHSYSSDDSVTLRPKDGELFDVYGAQDAREFVLIGLREGESCLEVSVNRREEECIEVRVLPPDE